jgi:ATP-GRASP peptide maturase of grasp-with-spasm system
MILINSSHTDDSTNKIIDWLVYLKKPFIRINDSDLIEINSIDFEDGRLNILLSIGEISLRLDTISCYFYRRGYLNVRVSKTNPSISAGVGKEFAYSYLKYLQNETASINHFVKDTIEKQNGILSFDKANINKLAFLNACILFKLKVPESAIVNTLEEIEHFQKKWGNIITKPVNNGFFSTSKEWFYTFTNEIVKHETLNFDKSFNYTLIQKKINKKFEIRAFFFKGMIYSNAIFSQNDLQTSVDFRHYNKERPNRNVPFELPNEIKQKIVLLMNHLRLETGSFDIVYTMNKEFVFLEVNPIGQYSQVSNPSNYQLDKIIAENL